MSLLLAGCLVVGGQQDHVLRSTRWSRHGVRGLGTGFAGRQRETSGRTCCACAHHRWVLTMGQTRAPWECGSHGSCLRDVLATYAA